MILKLRATAVLFLASFAPAGFSAACAADAQQVIDARIGRIENGLLGKIGIAGRPNPGRPLAERMAAYKTPGLSIAVINHGEIEWAKGYGVLSADGTQAVNADTVFQAASVSKPVFAMAALALVQQGKLALDENVNLRLASWKLPENEFTKEKSVTLRALLSHSAGTTVHGFRGYAEGEAVPTVPQLLDGLKPANSAAVRVDQVPSTAFRYSGGGYTLAQLLATDVAQRPFAQLMQETVLSPIGMQRSIYAQPLPAEWQANAAVAHNGAGKPYPGKWHTYPEMAAAGLWTTASDLARFALEVQRSAAGKSNKVLNREMAGQMLAKGVGPFGLGLIVTDAGGEAALQHNGANAGFRSQMILYTGRGQGAVVMVNGDNGLQLADEILRSIGAEYGWSDYRMVLKTMAAVDPKTLGAYVGTYQVSGLPVAVTREGDRLFVQARPLGAAPNELYAEGADKFFMTGHDVGISFVREGDEVKEIIVHGPQVLRGTKQK